MGDYVEKCAFCNISNKKADAEIIFEDDEFMIFKDIKPAAEIHYLCIPKRHIVSTARDLNKTHLELINKMVQISKTVVEDGPSVRRGFHWPPLIFVKHLHMHIIKPIEQLSFFGRLLFRPNNRWFVTDNEVIDWIMSQ